MHVHAIETFNLGTRWWKDNAAECGLGFMAEEDEARTAGGAAHYVSKYLSKSLGAQEWPKGWRRVRTSQRWPKLPEMPPAEGWTWRVVNKRESLVGEMERLNRIGIEAVFLNHAEAWSFVLAEMAAGAADGEQIQK